MSRWFACACGNLGTRIFESLQSLSMSDRPRFALRFISGKYQGGEFPLRMNREIIIGRSSDLDMVLVEDMVSRRHAKISSTDNDVYIQDMGSTNGTFVNGEKIAGRALLHEGDRILVGTSIIKVVAVEGQVANQSEAEARRRLEAGAQQRQATQGRRCRASSRRFRSPTCSSCSRPAASRAC